MCGIGKIVFDGLLNISKPWLRAGTSCDMSDHVLSCQGQERDKRKKETKVAPRMDSNMDPWVGKLVSVPLCKVDLICLNV